MLVRVDMNHISTRRNSENTYVQPSSIGWKGVSYLDLTKILRTQIPNASDIDLRGFSGGFACTYELPHIDFDLQSPVHPLSSPLAP